MADIQKQITHKKSKEETRKFIDEQLLNLPMLKAVVSKAEWQEDKLIIEAIFGTGTIAIEDNKSDVEIHLSFMGKMSRQLIEDTINNEFKKLTE
jgi:23S rRNA G2445 N2-methylase RlmL